MADSDLRAPPPPKHLDAQKKPCSGSLLFLKSTEVPPGTRSCQDCGRLETYEKDTLIVVGQEGVSAKELVEFCKKMQDYFNKKMPGYYLSPDITVIQSKDASKIVSARVMIPGAEMLTDPEILLTEMPEYEKLVTIAYRKLKVIYDKTVKR